MGCSGNVEWRDALENSRCEVLYSFLCRGGAARCDAHFHCEQDVCFGEFRCSGVSEVLSSSSPDGSVTLLNNFNWLASLVGGSQMSICGGILEKAFSFLIM